MNHSTANMTGVLLAGGKSRRMGHDKRFLELEGRTLLERSLSVLESLFSEVIVVVAEPVPFAECSGRFRDTLAGLGQHESDVHGSRIGAGQRE